MRETFLDAPNTACPPAGEAGPVGRGMTAWFVSYIRSSWPGPDPAIHVVRRPPSVDARVKHGHDDLVCVLYPLVIPRRKSGVSTFSIF